MPAAFGSPDLLGGLRVLDLSRLLPGPYTTMLLGDLGAEVIKVEHPRGGDPARTVIPDVFGVVNRNKKSLTLDLKAPEGREVFLRLAAGAAVVVEGFRPGVAARLGVDHEAVRAVNPGVVYCSISGYGQEGPYRDRPNHDLTVLALTGALAVPGEPGAAPSRPGLPVADLGASMFALSSVLAALYRRERTGEGAYVDVALTDGVLSWLSLRLGDLLVGGRATPPEEMPHLSPANAVFEGADGKRFAVAAIEDAFWLGLCRALERPDWAGDSRYADHPSRSKRWRELLPELRRLFLAEDRRHWLGRLESEGVPCAPVNEPAEALEDPQLRYRGIIVETDWGGDFGARQVAYPTRFTAGGPSPLAVPTMAPPPALGEHTESILAAAGYGPDEIARLRAGHVV